MRASDVMTSSVITVKPETPVADVARLLVERRISGVPVVDQQGRVVGILTEGDLFRRHELGTERRRGRLLEMFTSNVTLAAEYVQSHGRTAGDVMTSEVISVTPDTALTTISDIFEKERIKRVPVIKDGRLLGIVSRGNLVQALGSLDNGEPSSAADDRRIRDEVLAEFTRLPWGLDSESNVVVASGIVHLWGLVGTRQEQAALRVAAEAIPGVKGIMDHTILIHRS